MIHSANKPARSVSLKAPGFVITIVGIGRVGGRSGGYLMRLLTVVGVVATMAAPMPATEVHAKPVGPPDTLASERKVSRGERVLSEFPIDFLGVIYDGDVEGGAVRFRTDGRWGPWVELQDDGVEVDGQWASGLVAGSDAEAYQVRVPDGARSPRAVVINTTDGPAQARGHVG